MRLVKFLILFIILSFLGLVGSWYYVTDKVAIEINSKYANKPIALQGIDQEDYFVSFKDVKPSGFPYKISWQLDGWFEESRTTKIRYTSPIYFGYDLALQKLFITYDGEIIASYKPESHKFGSKLKVSDYSIKIDLPLSRDLIKNLGKFEDPFEIVNYFGDINAKSGSVDIYDLEKNEKFYDKDYEHLKISYVPQKYYKNSQDFLNNIPQYLIARYNVKTNPISAEPRRLPVSLFYGFSMLPSGFNIDADIDLKTKGSNLKDLNKGLEIKVLGSAKSDYIHFNEFKLDYTSGLVNFGNNYTTQASSKMFFRTGMFDQIFDRYNLLLSPKLRLSPIGAIIDREIKYIIANKDEFKFKELENNSYKLNLDISSMRDKSKNKLYVNDFSIFSANSGIKLKHEMEKSAIDPKNWQVDGLLLIQNYPAVVEFSSGYIYRFGKFKLLKDEARDLYIEVNKKFLKDISDYPKSSSNDLSFEYSANSNNLNRTKFGTVRFDQIAKLYTLTLYQKLLNKVGNDGDVISKMQKIIPDLDTNEPMLQKIIPKISNNNDIGKSLEKSLDKVIPGKTKDVIKKSLPKDLQNKVLKGLFK